MEAINAVLNSISVFTETYNYLRLSKDTDANLESLKFKWAHEIMKRLNVELKTEGEIGQHSPMLLVGNHISYLDIPILTSTVKSISFVAKQELASWPVFGSAAQKIDTVFVKRENMDSRNLARESIKQALLKGKRVVIFPSGTTCMLENTSWKKGAFEIAKELNVPIQPFRINYFPLRSVAYIDKDFFPVHLYNLAGLKKISANLEFHSPVFVREAILECEYWRKWSQTPAPFTTIS
jgi:1-acyl-sn-glycerol-3-phosphate acyltransferase